MSLPVLIYNLLMTVTDAAALFWLGRRKTAATLRRLGMLETLAALALAGALGNGFFGTAGLLAYALFVHAVVFLLGAAAVLRRECPRTALSAIFLALVLALAAGDAFFIEPAWLEVSHLRLPAAKLSRPVRIAVVADLQTDAFGSYEQEALRRVVEERPDLILLAGDYVQAESPRREEIQGEIAVYLRRIGFTAPLGVFAVQGNCDDGPWQQAFAGLSVTAVDWTRSLKVGELELTCLSLRDSFDGKLTIPAAEAGRYHVVLGHSPNYALGRVDADLLIAGHTHGGQVRLPWLGPLVTLSRVPRSWAAGLTELPGGANLLVPRGIGMERGPAPRLRFLCRPELVFIDLEP